MTKAPTSQSCKEKPCFCSIRDSIIYFTKIASIQNKVFVCKLWHKYYKIYKIKLGYQKS